MTRAGSRGATPRVVNRFTSKPSSALVVNWKIPKQTSPSPPHPQKTTYLGEGTLPLTCLKE